MILQAFATTPALSVSTGTLKGSVIKPKLTTQNQVDRANREGGLIKALLRSADTAGK